MVVITRPALLVAAVIIIVIVIGASVALVVSHGSSSVSVGSISVGVSSFDAYRVDPSISNVPVKVNYVIYSLTPSLFDALLRGEVDIAILPADLAGLALLQSNNTYVVAVDFPLFQGIVVPAGSNITSPAQLAGKTVAIPVGTGTYYLFVIMMKELYNLTVSPNLTGPDVVHVINAAPGNVIDAVLTGSAQAGVIWQPMLAEAVELYHMRVIATYQEMWHNLTGQETAPFLVWVATSKLVSNRHLLVNVLTLHAESAEAWDHNESLAALALEKLYGVPGNVSQLVWASTNDTPTSVCINQQEYQELVSEWQYLVRSGFFTAMPNTSRILTCSDLGLS
nr:PhnD/SsuA/transferrin family substrate-binding protein [Acidilobus saccharovorans]